ncbi:Heat shock factor protein 5 [Collichthys lucidus]|uniref:Heat shock factor protein 5 n=1 Tax=Collichthys lucidus TaxID=240159 RepID=A0A4U5V7E8_COLLU|nr:Heat shock factor protein 5 [Collichthys lucidus]
MDVGGNSLPNSINPNHYPAKLWRLVNNPANEAICWDSEGTFVIIDQLLFEKQILSLDAKNLDNADAFKTTNFLSIVRQLYMYGFRKAGLVIQNDVQSGGEQKRFHHFYNPNFKRNHPELLGSLMRFTVNNRVRVRVSTMQDNPLCDTPITISTLGSVYVDKEQEELVLSVPEKMPEDAIIQRARVREGSAAPGQASSTMTPDTD